MLSLTSCPKYQTCNAPVCPVDPDWHKRSNCSEDPTCFYLTESVKHGAQAVFEGAGLGELFAEIHRQAQPISDRHPRIRRALERAKETGSRMARGFSKKGNQ